MNFFERRLEQSARRIKRIRENPDPSRMRSNLLMYEVEHERYTALNEAWKAGKPFSISGHAALMHALGFHNVSPRGMADASGRETANKCYDLIRKEGFPEMTCDRAVMPTVMPMLGELPVPSFLEVSNAPCEHAGNSYKVIADYYKVPYFVVDVPFTATEESLVRLSGELTEMVEYAESLGIPGIKYSEDKLRKSIEDDMKMMVYFKDIFKLLQRVPCPIDPREGFREVTLTSNYPNPERVLEWAKLRRDELYERAQKKVGALREEKLRAIWLVTGYNNDRAPLDYLESRGVAVINRIDGMGSTRTYGRVPTYGDTKQFGRKLTIIEEMARGTLNSIWLGMGDRWTDEVVRMAKDLKCDFVINFIQSGCLVSIGLAQIVADKLEKAGIASFRIEGRGLFTEGYNAEQVIGQFKDFIDMLMDKKGLPRS